MKRAWLLQQSICSGDDEPMLQEIVYNEYMADNSNNEIWVFLSHSNKDYEKVRIVRNILEEHGFRPLMFFFEISPNCNCLYGNK